MNWHTLAAVGLWVFVAVTMEWNRIFRAYCLESLEYFENEVLPQLQHNKDFNKETITLESETIPETYRYAVDSTLIIIALVCTLIINSVLLLFIFTDIPVSGFLNGLVAFGNATTAVWVSISRIRYFKIRAHVYAQHTILLAEEFYKESLSKLKIEEKQE